MSNAIEKDGYLYDPPSWVECDDCDGTGVINCTQPCIPHDGQCIDCTDSDTKKRCPKCADSPKPGYLPVRYTPEEWEAAKGILTDDTPVFEYREIISRNQSKGIKDYFLEHYGDRKRGRRIIATSAGKPKEK